MMSRLVPSLLLDHKLAYQTIVQYEATKDLTEVIIQVHHTVVDEVLELETTLLTQKGKIHIFEPRPHMPGEKKSWS